MILRFRGRDGAYRVNVEPGQSFADAVAMLEPQLPPHEGPVAVAASPSAPAEAVNAKWQQPLSQLGVKHGDMFFVSYSSPSTNSGPKSTSETTAKPGPEDVTLSPLDQEMILNPGLIPRGRSSLCSHGPRGMCEYCQPLDPWDTEYQYQHGIKHLSFWAYTKKLQEEAPSSAANRILEEPVYDVDRACKNGHIPWPKGICSKCQPPAITLQQQRFRMVDHVEFANPSIVSDFIEFWRQSNNQRAGFLIGRYERYDAVPLGVKAVVHAIWEPEQENEHDALLLKQLPPASARLAAEALGCEIVGLIFTDLADAGKGDGTVVTKRHAYSYFLSSLEILLAARMQNSFAYQTPLSGKGHFGSRFVTCVISGNERGEIDVACYQASIQAQALARSDLICASANPSVMRIMPPTDERYVPDAVFKHRNEYGLAVQENAKPAFPVDYLLVSVTHGFPDKTQPIVGGFPIENRPNMRVQSVSQLASQLGLASGLDSTNLGDFHLLTYLLSLGVLQRDEETALSELLAAERGNDETRAIELATQLAHGSGFATLRTIAQT